MFSVLARSEKFEKELSLVVLDLCLRKTRSDKSRDYPSVITFKNPLFKNVFRPHLQIVNVNPAFSNSSGLKTVFAKLCFCDGLLWTVGLTLEIELRFQFCRV